MYSIAPSTDCVCFFTAIRQEGEKTSSCETFARSCAESCRRSLPGWCTHGNGTNHGTLFARRPGRRCWRRTHSREFRWDGAAEQRFYDALDTAFGVTATNRTGAGLNIVQFTGSPTTAYGNNFVVKGQIASPPNVLSSGHFTNGASQFIADDVDFVFAQPGRAAGLWIGSVGGGDCVSNPTIVEFLNVRPA